MPRNITLSLDDETLGKARVAAARRNLSVSAFLRQEIDRLAREEDAYNLAQVEAEARLQRGTHLGGGPLPAREELHDRAALR